MNSAPSETSSDGSASPERDRGQPDAEQPAEQQPGGGEGAGDEPLPVAGQGVRQHQHHQQPVEQVHPRRRCSNSVFGQDVLVEPPADQHVRRDLLLGRVGQVLDPAEVLEEAGDHAGGEAPADDVVVVADEEARGCASPPGPVTVIRWRRVAQLADRHPVDRVHLVRRDHAAPALGSRHQASTGVTEKLLGGSHSGGSSAKTSTPAGRARSPPSLAQRGLPSGLAGVDRAAGEGHLAGVRAHRVAALGQQQVGPVGSLAEEHQHRADPGLLVLGRHEPGQVVDGDRAGGLLDRPQPVGEARCSGSQDSVHSEVLADQVGHLVARSRGRRSHW